jgi:hypothetical protein
MKRCPPCRYEPRQIINLGKTSNEWSARTDLQFLRCKNLKVQSYRLTDRDIPRYLSFGGNFKQVFELSLTAVSNPDLRKLRAFFKRVRNLRRLSYEVFVALNF